MLVVLGLLAFFILLDVSALAGWAPSTRDSRDWRSAQPAVGHASPVQRVTAAEAAPSSFSGAPQGTHAPSV